MNVKNVMHYNLNILQKKLKKKGNYQVKMMDPNIIFALSSCVEQGFICCACKHVLSILLNSAHPFTPMESFNFQCTKLFLCVCFPEERMQAIVFFPTTFLVIMRRAVHQIIKIYVCQVLLKNRHQLVSEYFRKSGQKFSFKDSLQK